MNASIRKNIYTKSYLTSLIDNKKQAEFTNLVSSYCEPTSKVMVLAANAKISNFEDVGIRATVTTPATERFDIIVVRYGLNIYQDIQTILSDVRFALKPNGLVFCKTLLTTELGLARNVQRHLMQIIGLLPKMRHLSRQAINQELENAGFSVCYEIKLTDAILLTIARRT